MPPSLSHAEEVQRSPFPARGLVGNIREDFRLGAPICGHGSRLPGFLLVRTGEYHGNIMGFFIAGVASMDHEL